MDKEKEKDKTLPGIQIHAAAGAVTGMRRGDDEDEKGGGGGSGGSKGSAPFSFSPAHDRDYISIDDTLAGYGLPEYDSPYAEELKRLYGLISDRDPFSYSAEADPLYLQYRDKYSMDGELAMRDTMGQAASLTGGYGSSYSQAAGQQQYGEYMRSLNDMLPELYKQAYREYQDEGDWLMRQYGLTDSAEQRDYSRYRDSVGDIRDERDLELQLQDRAYDRLMYMMQSGPYLPSEEELLDAGLTPRQAEELYRNMYYR